MSFLGHDGRMRRGLAVVVLLLCSSLGLSAEASRFTAVPLPLLGPGYVVPPTWAARGLHFGTPELVGLLQRTAKRVRAWDHTATLYIGDLSLPNGAATRWHRSHRRGIDADLLLFTAHPNGAQLPPPRAMKPFARNDRSLDLWRNWLLAKALVTDGTTSLTHLFLANFIKRRVLEQARAHGEDPRLLAKVSHLCTQPTDSSRHDDHLHIRVGTR